MNNNNNIDDRFVSDLINDIVFILSIVSGLLGLFFIYMIIDNQRIWRIYRILAK